MAEPLGFTGINHISLTVSNLQKSLDFYAGLFGGALRKEGAVTLVREIPTGISTKIRDLGATLDSAEANRRINFQDPDGVRLSIVVA